MASVAFRRPAAHAAVVAVVVALMAAATVAVTLSVLASDRSAAQQREERRADQAAAVLRATLDRTVRRVSDVAAAIGFEGIGAAGSGTVPRGAALLERLFDEPALFGTGLALTIPDRDRAVLERRLGTPIKDPGPARAVAPRRSSYTVPVRVEYRDGGTAGLGVDLAGEPTRRAAISRAARTGRPQLTAPVRLVGSREQIVVIYAPLYAGGVLAGGPAGAVIASYRTAGLVRSVRRVLGSGARFGIDDGTTAFAGLGPRGRPGVVRTLAVGGRRLRLTVADEPPATAPGLAAGVGLGLITLLVGLLLARTGRRELTARRATTVESARRTRAENQFGAAFEQAPIGMAIIGLDGRVERANTALATLSGYPKDDLLGQVLPAMLHPEDRAHAEADLHRLVAGAATLETEKRLRRADGPMIWIACTATGMRGVDGAVDRILLQVQDVSVRRAYEQRLQHLASHDPLTGLLNRRAFSEELDRHVERVRRSGSRGAVLMLDLDHFKTVNDLFGHGAGDRLIIEVAHRLRSRLRATDTLCRLGGDEFAVLLPDADDHGAALVAQTLLEAVRAADIADTPTPRRTTASIGLVNVVAAESLSGEGLLVNADLALYDAKDAGRDRVETYRAGPQDRLRTEARISWVDRIHRALDDHDFVLHYQPIRDLATGRIVALEALVRLQQDDGDLVLPGSFLPVAERYGLAPRIDRWVLERSVTDLALLEHEGLDVTVSANLSAHSLSEPTLLATLETLLARHAVTPSRLLLELTESAAIDDLPQAQAFARRLRALGCRLALDDFGSGFGSFYYLKHLPFDVLKIDGEFVRSCTEERLDRHIVSAIVDIARGAGSVTVAEHVVNDACAARLLDLGVDQGQGYHLGRPASLEVVRAQLRAQHLRA